MKRDLFMTLIAFAAINFAQANNGDQILMTIGDKKVSKAEFEYIFNKNNNAKTNDSKAIDEYVTLFEKFKLKVLDAQSKGMDTTQTFRTELSGYFDQLAKPYLTDRELNDTLIAQAYFRMANEVNASHLLLRFPENMKPEDTVALYNRIVNIKNEIDNGLPFEDAARKYSEDPSVAQNGGLLGYFSGFQMVFPFEEAAYNTPVGKVSNPLRTQFGYHLLKVNDKRLSRGEVLVNHILFLVDPQMTPEQRKAKEDAAKNAYKRILENPAMFEKIAAEESDDVSTAEKNGELPWFKTGDMVFEFQEQAFSLKDSGSFTQPFQTQFGWHLIKLKDKRTVASFSELKEEIEANLLRSDRGQLPEESFIAKLKRDYKFTLVRENVEAFYDLSKNYGFQDSMFLVKTRGMKKPIILLDGTTITQDKFADYLIANPNKDNASEVELINSKFDKFERSAILDYEKSVLERKHVDFRNLIQEYRDGMLLFEISSQEVWNKASSDEKGLVAFHKKNKKQYKWDVEHFAGKIYYCKNDSVKQVVQGLLNTKVDDSDILKQLNDSLDVVRIEDAIYGKGQNNTVDHFIFASGDFKPVAPFNAAIVVGKTYKKGVPKELEVTRGAVISDYQNFLEEQWIKSLRKKYPIKIDKKVLETVSIK